MDERDHNKRLHLSCSWRFFDMLVGNVSIVGTTVSWSEALARLCGPVLNRPLDARAARGPPSDDKWERKGKKSGRGGRKTGSGVADR